MQRKCHIVNLFKRFDLGGIKLVLGLLGLVGQLRLFKIGIELAIG